MLCFTWFSCRSESIHVHISPAYWFETLPFHYAIKVVKNLSKVVSLKPLAFTIILPSCSRTEKEKQREKDWEFLCKQNSQLITARFSIFLPRIRNTLLLISAHKYATGCSCFDVSLMHFIFSSLFYNFSVPECYTLKIQDPWCSFSVLHKHIFRNSGRFAIDLREQRIFSLPFICYTESICFDIFSISCNFTPEKLAQLLLLIGPERC
jgi:hypothetical protein